ncbi:MAG TPA: hypothetical protein VLI54_03280 [Bacillota bacterium]|nr:hypothetical protein [Bacillota bacterium]
MHDLVAQRFCYPAVSEIGLIPRDYPEAGQYKAQVELFADAFSQVNTTREVPLLKVGPYAQRFEEIQQVYKRSLDAISEPKVFSLDNIHTLHEAQSHRRVSLIHLANDAVVNPDNHVDIPHDAFASMTTADFRMNELVESGVITREGILSHAHYLGNLSILSLLLRQYAPGLGAHPAAVISGAFIGGEGLRTPSADCLRVLQTPAIKEHMPDVLSLRLHRFEGMTITGLLEAIQAIQSPVRRKGREAGIPLNIATAVELTIDRHNLGGDDTHVLWTGTTPAGTPYEKPKECVASPGLWNEEGGVNEMYSRDDLVHRWTQLGATGFLITTVDRPRLTN